MNNFHFAKIVVTMGPCFYKETLISKIANYVDIFRINLAYTNEDAKRKYIETIMKIDSSKGIIIDIKGPEVRTQNARIMDLSGLEKIYIRYSQLKNDDDDTIFIDYSKFKNMKTGKNIYIDDNKVCLKITDVAEDLITCSITSGSEIHPNKNVNFESYVPDVHFLTEKDKTDILWAIKNNISMLSFGSIISHKDILTVKDFLKENNGENTKVISKIETKESLNDIEEIIKNSDGIIISRGKLGFNIPIEEIPLVQLNIIKLSNKYGKPVILGHQVLDSMNTHSEPTKAELDEIVLNMINGVDGFMLSSETAIGNHPVETIIALHNTICKNQEAIKEHFGKIENEAIQGDELQDSIIYNAYQMSKNNGVKAILCPTESGYTATKLASLKTQVPIIAFTKNDYVFRYANLLRAVKGYKISTTLDYNLIKRVGKEMIRMMFKGDINLDDKILILNINSNIAQDIPNMINGIEVYKFKEL